MRIVKNFTPTPDFVRLETAEDISGIVNQSITVDNSGEVSFDLDIAYLIQSDPNPYKWIFSLLFDDSVSVDFPTVQLSMSNTTDRVNLSLALTTTLSSGAHDVRIQWRAAPGQQNKNELQVVGATVFQLACSDEPTGSGAVDSVNGFMGTVVLDTDDISDSAATNKYTTSSDISKLAGIEALADVTDEANVVSSLDGATIPSASIATADKLLFQDADDNDELKQDTVQNLSSLIGGSVTVTLYTNTMTADQWTVSNVLSNTAGAGMQQVGNGSTHPYVQCTGVVISGVTDIIEISFEALVLALGGSTDLLLGYQIGSNTAVWGSYTRISNTLCAQMNKTTSGIAAGTYTVKLMAAKSGAGNADIAASDSTTYGVDQIPAGAIFTVKVTQQ